MRAWLLVIVAVVAACDDPQVSGPGITVFRETAAGCFEKLSISDALGASTELYGTGEASVVKTCAGDSARPELLAGIDVVEVVIDYGTDLPATATIPAPAPVVLVDGAPTTTPVSVQPRPRFADHTYFLATFTAPNAISSNVRVSVPVTTGYASDDPTVFATVAPGIALSVLRETDDGCEVVSPTPPSPDLGLASCGPARAVPAGSILAGFDVVELVIDYGELDAAATARIAAPAPIVVVGGVATTTNLVVGPALIQGGHTAFVARFSAPAVVSSNVRFVVPVTAGVSVEDPAVYSLVTPTSVAASTAKLSVLRLASTGCELLSASAPDSALGLETCSSSLTGAMLAGLDQIELVIDYGDLHLPANAPVPVPVPSLSASGSLVPISPSTRLQPARAGHTFFLSTFTAPNVLSNAVQISVAISPGSAIDDRSTYATTAPPVVVSVLDQTAAGCFAPITGTVSPAAVLGIPDLCGPDVPSPSLVHAGVDLLQLVVDYGALDLPAATAPPPSAAIVAGGAQVGPTLTSFTAVQQPGASGHTYFTINFHAPQVSSGSAVLAVRAAAETVALHDISLAVSLPIPELAIDECPDVGVCSVQGGVGFIHARVVLPGDVSEAIALVGSFGDGSPSDPIPSAVTSGVLGDNRGGVAIPIPPAPDGTTWNLTAALGAAVSPSRQLVIRRPTIAAVLSCQDPCTLAPQTDVGLAVTAPRNIQQATAIVSATLDGVPVLAPASFDLSSIDNDAGTVGTVVRLTSPAATGTWAIDVVVDGYRKTILAQVR